MQPKIVSIDVDGRFSSARNDARIFAVLDYSITLDMEKMVAVAHHTLFNVVERDECWWFHPLINQPANQALLVAEKKLSPDRPIKSLPDYVVELTGQAETFARILEKALEVQRIAMETAKAIPIEGLRVELADWHVAFITRYRSDAVIFEWSIEKPFELPPPGLIELELRKKIREAQEYELKRSSERMARTASDNEWRGHLARKTRDANRALDSLKAAAQAWSESQGAS